MAAYTVNRTGSPITFQVAKILRKIRATYCRSSGVERAIGNGEVDSSILSGGTIPFNGLAYSPFS